nr:MAG TPA: hypothetical protein [Bacteriophage sp.]
MRFYWQLPFHIFLLNISKQHQKWATLSRQSCCRLHLGNIHLYRATIYSY